MAAHQDREMLATTSADDHGHPHAHQLADHWDPSSILNPSMLSTDFLSQQNHFDNPVNAHPQAYHHASSNGSHHHHHQQQTQFTSAVPHPPQHQSQFEPSNFDVYNHSVHNSFDNARFQQPGAQQPVVGPSGNINPPQAHEFFYAPQIPPFSQPNSDVGHPAHPTAHPTAHSQPPFDMSGMHSTPPITPNDGHRNASPYTMSPVSDGGFAQQQQSYPAVLERPSTSGSIHSYHSDVPQDEFGLGAHGVVPSSLHPFDRPFIHMPPDVSNRNFLPHTVNKQPHHHPNPAFSHPHLGQGQLPQQPYGFSSQPSYIPEGAVHVTPGVLDSPSIFPAPASVTNSGSDIANFIRPVLQKYVEARNRIAFGERTVIVMASKVAQKSYGQERRFLCPPPTAIMIGNSWWNETAPGREDRKPPRVTVSISGESVPPECAVEWSSTAGKQVDPSDPPPDDVTYLGRAVGKQLFISDERQKKVEALVKIVAPSSEDEPERIIGTFPSRPIKVISKPSKKRQSAKNMERASFKGSDGQPLPGIDPRARGGAPSFVARTGTWDPFIIYIVDVSKPLSGPDIVPPPPLQADYPSPPPNAIAFTHHGAHIPIYYNQTVVLQCLTSGVVSPVLIIRKVDHDTIVVGGGLQEGAKGVPDHFCAPGEVCGDPVSQLHKVAFEVYDSTKGVPAPGTTGATSAFLSCMGEKVNTYRPSEGRAWNSPEVSSGGSRSPSLPDSPAGSSTGSLTDYFSPNGSPTGSAPSSPMLDHAFPQSADGGRVRRNKRSGSSAGAPIVRTQSKARRRVNSVGSNVAAGPIPSSTRYGLADQAMSSGALWSIDIGESAVWTIVGTEQIRYNFYVPQIPGIVCGIPPKQVTPFPNIVKYLPPDQASEVPKMHMNPRQMMKPDPRTATMLTVYGENFSKADPPMIFFGIEPSPFVDVRCQEVLACMPPEVKGEPGVARPIFIVRSDGIIYPSNVFYHGK